MKPILTILISTLEDGIYKCEKAVSIRMPEIQYLIIHQTERDIVLPTFLDRGDIQVISTPTSGLSKSRNIGIGNCNTQYALISDDDVIYIRSGLEKVIDLIENYSIELATFKIKPFESRKEYKNYPKYTYKITHKPKHWFSSIEILINIPIIKERNIKFDERFGLGASVEKGEEEIFISDCIKNKIIGFYYPIYIVCHSIWSSGKQKKGIKDHIFFRGCIDKRVGRISLSLIKWFMTFKINNIMNYYRGRKFIKNTN